MLVRNIKEFKIQTNKKKIICLDCGKKKIGVAICDESHKVSMPMQIIERNSNYKEILLKLILDFDVGGILIGLPILHDKQHNKMCCFIMFTHVSFGGIFWMVYTLTLK